MDAKARLQSMKVTEGGNIKAYLNFVITTRNKVFSISIPVSEKYFTTMIIGLLPKFYLQFLSNLSAALETHPSQDRSQ